MTMTTASVCDAFRRHHVPKVGIRHLHATATWHTLRAVGAPRLQRVTILATSLERESLGIFHGECRTVLVG